MTLLYQTHQRKKQMKKVYKLENVRISTLISLISEASDLSKSDSKKVLKAMLHSIQIGLKEDKVTLPGFGTFIVTQFNERRCWNPSTKKMMELPASKMPRFRPSKMLRKEIS
jgi:DNA-binding protein HU-beta